MDLSPGALILPPDFLAVGFAGLSSCPSETISSTVRTDRPSATIRLARRSIAAASLSPSKARA